MQIKLEAALVEFHGTDWQWPVWQCVLWKSEMCLLRSVECFCSGVSRVYVRPELLLYRNPTVYLPRVVSETY